MTLLNDVGGNIAPPKRGGGDRSDVTPSKGRSSGHNGGIVSSHIDLVAAHEPIISDNGGGGGWDVSTSPQTNISGVDLIPSSIDLIGTSGVHLVGGGVDRLRVDHVPGGVDLVPTSIDLVGGGVDWLGVDNVPSSVDLIGTSGVDLIGGSGGVDLVGGASGVDSVSADDVGGSGGVDLVSSDEAVVGDNGGGGRWDVPASPQTNISGVDLVGSCGVDLVSACGVDLISSCVNLVGCGGVDWLGVDDVTGCVDLVTSGVDWLGVDNVASGGDVGASEAGVWDGGVLHFEFSIFF